MPASSYAAQPKTEFLVKAGHVVIEKQYFEMSVQTIFWGWFKPFPKVNFNLWNLCPKFWLWYLVCPVMQLHYIPILATIWPWVPCPLHFLPMKSISSYHNLFPIDLQSSSLISSGPSYLLINPSVCQKLCLFSSLRQFIFVLSPNLSLHFLFSSKECENWGHQARTLSTSFPTTYPLHLLLTCPVLFPPASWRGFSLLQAWNSSLF